MHYDECPNCGATDESFGDEVIYNNGTRMASCLNCGWEESEDKENKL